MNYDQLMSFYTPPGGQGQGLESVVQSSVKRIPGLGTVYFRDNGEIQLSADPSGSDKQGFYTIKRGPNGEVVKDQYHPYTVNKDNAFTGALKLAGIVAGGYALAPYLTGAAGAGVGAGAGSLGVDGGMFGLPTATSAGGISGGTLGTGSGASLASTIGAGGGFDPTAQMMAENMGGSAGYTGAGLDASALATAENMGGSAGIAGAGGAASAGGTAATSSVWDQIAKALGISPTSAAATGLKDILGGVLGGVLKGNAGQDFKGDISAAAAAADPFGSQRGFYQTLFHDMNSGAVNPMDVPWMKNLRDTTIDNTAQRLSSKYGGDVSSLGVRNAITQQVNATNAPVANDYLKTIGNAAGMNIQPSSGSVLANAATTNLQNTNQANGNYGTAANALWDYLSKYKPVSSQDQAPKVI